jgi:hypothetical protein
MDVNDVSFFVDFAFQACLDIVMIVTVRDTRALSSMMARVNGSGTEFDPARRVL